MLRKNVNVRDINISEYDYFLPDERIARFPLAERDMSKLLVYRDGCISESVFNRLPDYLPDNSLIVFNNTRVIQARLLFKKDTGAQIEVFCLEPFEPHDYAMNFQARNQCIWNCMVGNLKRWKAGCLKHTFLKDNKTVTLTAEMIDSGSANNPVRKVLFRWDNDSCFSEILEAAGILPIPPYLGRDTEKSDLQTYQTVYSKVDGSVAAPTAGLHFTDRVLGGLDRRGFLRDEITLHVGAGTFKPVQTEALGGHEMHSEFISVNRSTVKNLIENENRVIAVGTTCVRTLESLYHIGAMLTANPDATAEMLVVKQWAPYQSDLPDIPVCDALNNILCYLDRHRLDKLVTSTKIIIAPDYRFRIVNAMVTNFHQPRSTLLLLVSAFVNGDWQNIYNYALSHGFRFLSYGDSSLLFATSNASISTSAARIPYHLKSSVR